MNKRLLALKDAVEKELVKAKKGYIDARKSAQEISAAASLSPSQAGDRFHSQNAAELANERLETILALKKEIEEKGEKIVKQFNGKEIFLVDNPITLDGFTFVSSHSPLGLKLTDGNE